MGNQFKVYRIEKMKNRRASKYFFEMDSDELMEAYQRSSREGIDIIGVFHSHLEDADPSSSDLIYMEINPIVWVIYSCKYKKFQAYLSNEKMVGVTIMVKD
jgi:proteasome lid subunit RPN8/RPN11